MAKPPPDKTRKKRGAPPVVTLRKRPARKKATGANPRAIASNIMLFGAVALASYGVSDWLDRKFNCEPDPNNPTAAPGVYDVRSGAPDKALDGTAYSAW